MPDNQKQYFKVRDHRTVSRKIAERVLSHVLRAPEDSRHDIEALTETIDTTRRELRERHDEEATDA